MITLVFASQKGGGGKTTLSGHIAVEAMKREQLGEVVMIDTDPQASLSGWWRERQGGMPAMVKLLPEGLKATLAELKASGIGMVVIDTPPNASILVRDTCKLADLVVVPTKPSPHDLRAVAATVNIVRGVKRPMVFVINQVTQRARITAEAAVALSQHGAVATPLIHHRVDFQTSMTDGRVAGELDANSKSAAEIAALWDYLHDRVQQKGAV